MDNKKKVEPLKRVEKPRPPTHNAIGDDLDRVFKAILDRYYGRGSEQESTYYNIPVTEDLTSQIDGATSHFTLSYTAKYKVEVSCNLRQLPTSIIMDDDMRGFWLTYVPTTRDKLVVEYFR